MKNEKTLSDIIKTQMELEKEEVEKLFVHRWAAPAKIGETTYEKSAAIAQSIAYLMQKVAPTEAVSCQRKN